MKIINWLRKVTQLEPPRKTCAIASSPTNSDETQSKEVVPPYHQKVNQKQKRMTKIKLGCKNLNKMFVFSSILNLKTVQAMKMKEGMMGDKKEAELIGTVHVGNTQVLPINDVAITSPSTKKCGVPVEKRDQIIETAKTKSFSKIKELVKWAAATKAEKGGKYIRRKVLQYEICKETIKAVADDDDDDGYRVSSGSPKISFRLDIGSCSFTSSSVFSEATLSESSSTRSTNDNNNINTSPLSDSPENRIGNWITTDSEFVVLEL